MITPIKKLFREQVPFFLACPALVWQAVFLYVPFIIVFIFSFSDYGETGHFFSTLTFAHYAAIFDIVYLKVILNSFFLASATTLIAFLIAYPVAYYLAMKAGSQTRTLMLFGLILPSWTNFIVQIYAWFFLLERGGLFSQILYRLGLTKELPHLLNNYFSMLVGMVYCFLPFMIFPIYTVLEKMDTRLFEASADLGASWFVTLRKVIFPLSLPGVYAGCLLVFVPSFGEFAIPLLLGGSKRVFWGSVMVDKFLISRDWASGFALASSGIVFLISIGFAWYGAAYAYNAIMSKRYRRRPRRKSHW